MSGLGQAFAAVERLIAFLVILCVIFIPLGIWKLVEIAIWAWHHVHFAIS
jgi:hypothetical protein